MAELPQRQQLAAKTVWGELYSECSEGSAPSTITSEWVKLTGQICLDLDFSEFWPVNFALTGPICARADNVHILFGLDARGHHDWPVKATIRQELRL